MKRTINLLIIILLMFNLFAVYFSFNVSANEINLTDWEDFTTYSNEGGDSYISYHSTYELGGGDNWEIDLYDPGLGGIKSLHAKEDENNNYGSRGYVFFRQNYSYTDKIEILFRLTSITTTTDSSPLTYCYFLQNYTSSSWLWRMSWYTTEDGAGTNSFRIYMDDGSTNYQIYPTSATANLVFWCRIQNLGLNTVNISFWNSDFTSRYGYRVYGSNQDLFTIMRGLYVDCYTGSGTWGYNDIWIDDINITTGFPPGDDSDTCDVGGYSYVGNPTSEYASDYYYTDSFIELQPHTSLNGYGFAFDLYVNSGVYNNDNELANYHLWINNYYHGNPSGIIDGGDYGDVFRWCFSEQQIYNVSDDIVIELYHSEEDAFGNNWVLPQTAQFGDSSFEYYTVHHSDGDFQNGEFDYSTFGFDFRGCLWKLYYLSGDTQPIDDCDQTNSITLNNFYESHPTYDKPWLYEYGTCLFTVRVSQTATPYKLYMYYEGELTGFAQNFPLTLHECTRVYGYVPLNDGNYTIQIETSTGENITNKSFYIEDVDIDYTIYSTPNPSSEIEVYDVCAYFKYSVPNNCYLALFDSLDDTGSYSKRKFDNPINSSAGTHCFEYSNSLVGYEVHYWRIFENTDTGVYLPISNIHNHYIDSVDFGSGYITAKPNPIYEGDTTTISGEHSFYESDVRVFFEGNPIRSVGSEFSFETNPFDSKGQYTYSLSVDVNGTWQILDTVTIVVKHPSDDGTLPIPKMDAFTGVIFGAFIVIAFLMSPLFFMIGAKQINFKPDIPPTIYAITGSIGVVFATLIGCWGWEVPFFIIAVGIIVIFLFFLIGRRGE